MWGPWRSLEHRCISKNKPVNNTKSPPQSIQTQRGLLVNSTWLLDEALSALRVKKAKDPVIANIIMRLCPTNLMFSKHFASINHPPSRARWRSSLRARYRAQGGWGRAVHGLKDHGCPRRGQSAVLYGYIYSKSHGHLPETRLQRGLFISLTAIHTKALLFSA